MNPLVSTAWLSSRLEAPDIVILDATLPPVGVTPPVDVHGRYRARHIPGAVFFDIEAISDQLTSLPHMLPTAEAFSRSMSEMGVGDAMTIVIYEQGGVFSAARAWWMLRAFGAREVYLLDGGLRAWTDAGLPTDAEAVERPRASFHARLDGSVVKDLAALQRVLAAHGQVLDARSTGRFEGTAPEPRPGISSGHMPGALNLPFTELVRDGQLKPAEELRTIFDAKGLRLDQPITTSCGSGVTAAVLSLGLEIVGAKDVSLYDGSWAEYAQHPEAVIERGR